MRERCHDRDCGFGQSRPQRGQQAAGGAGAELETESRPLHRVGEEFGRRHDDCQSDDEEQDGVHRAILPLTATHSAAR